MDALQILLGKEKETRRKLV